MRQAPILCLLALAACTAGPNFKSPALITTNNDATPASLAAAYGKTALKAQGPDQPGSAIESQSLMLAQDIPDQWWALFHSEALNDLVRTAMHNSPTLRSAQATLRQSQALYEAQRGANYPAVNLNSGVARQLVAATTTGVPGGSLYTLYNASVGVSYTVDIAGARKRAIENAAAAIDFQRYQLEAAWLTLTGNVVTTAIQEASLRAQLQATQEILATQEQSLKLVRKQEELGSAVRAAVLAQQTAVAQTQAQIPALLKSIAQTRHQLAVLLGKLPGDPSLPTLSLEQLQLPEKLPLSLPSALVRQRPDIQASEAQLHQANAQVGITTANLYPQLTLTASDGMSALHPGDLFKSAFGFWSLIGGLTAPFFDGGALKAKQQASVDALDAAAGNYQQTVLLAFQNVANTLSALENDALALDRQRIASSSAKESFDLTKRQYELGGTNYLNLLDAQRTWLQTRTALVQSQAARYADSAALFQALGGGWWNRKEALPSVPAPSASARSEPVATAKP